MHIHTSAQQLNNQQRKPLGLHLDGWATSLPLARVSGPLLKSCLALSLAPDMSFVKRHWPNGQWRLVESGGSPDATSARIHTTLTRRSTTRLRNAIVPGLHNFKIGNYGGRYAKQGNSSEWKRTKCSARNKRKAGHTRWNELTELTTVSYEP